ncbi:MAG: copper-translocating P-type ATPase, partial [Abditibacteriota bacterium]|nr:copper-translocating P-type ATPase [Abditibacteriota bacterium]
KRRLVLSAVFLLALMYVTMGHNMLGLPLPTDNLIILAFVQMVLALAVMVINRKFFTSGFAALVRKSPNMDTLVALGSTASFGWSLFVLAKLFTAANPMALYMSELYFESAAMIPALITVGKLLEAISKGRTTDALKSLMRSAPKTAKVIRGGAEREVPVSEVAVGDIFLVRAGDMIPVDGVVLEGSGGVDESSLTGESVPADKNAGDKVSAATINKSGFLKCRASRVGADTTFSQIVRMVSDAAATKAPIARIADKVSAIFVPTVIIIAVVVIAGWLIAGRSAAFALARGISVLVISCPCALGLATPVAVMVGSGVGARNGILFKTGEALENTGKIAAAALDKTGTVTKGQPEVTDVLPAEGVSEAEFAGKAAAAESKSDHPLAKAVSVYGEPMGEVSSYKEIPGKGFESSAAGKTLRGGNGGYVSGFAHIPYYIKEEADRLSAAGKTVLFFAEDNRFLGAMAVADTLKDDSASAVRQLGKLGVEVIMLSGDNERTAGAVAREAGIDEVIAGVLPEGKEEVIRTLRKRGKVAMVGDGINDAPALTRADIGVAVGNGTDIAAESADVVLMGGGLSDLAAAVRLSRAALLNIRENLFWAFFYNALCIPLA